MIGHNHLQVAVFFYLSKVPAFIHILNNFIVAYFFLENNTFSHRISNGWKDIDDILLKV